MVGEEKIRVRVSCVRWEEYDEVSLSNWSGCVCKDNDTCQHMVGLI